MKEPFLKMDGSKNGLFCLWAPLLILFLSLTPTGIALASDGATEALEMRHQAELAIAEERSRGHAKLAEAMEQVLPGLLQEYLTTRDGTIALDTVDAAFVHEQFKVARAMEEPGVALALDVFSGPGTGYEYGLRTAIAKLADFSTGKAESISSAALDAHERIMKDHLDRIDTHLAKEEMALDRLERFTETRFTQTVETKGVELRVTPAVEVKVETKGATVGVTPGNGNSPVARDGTPGNSGSAPGRGR